MSNQNISLTFPEKTNEEVTSVFLLEDLIKEYNHKVVSDSSWKKRAPLSLSPLNQNSVNPIIRPMTKAEIDAMHSHKLKGDWSLLKNILQDQVGSQGLISNIPTIVQGVSLIELINELGIKGKIIYKTIGDKTYVILKGLAGERHQLKGTRYLNTNPQIVQFGLAKVDVKTLFKTGFKTSLWVYGTLKIVEATDMLLQTGHLETSFFSKVGTDIPKIAITGVVTAAAAGAVAVTSIPVAVGVGVVLVVGFAAGVALEFLDQKIGLTNKLNDAADRMWKNLGEHLSNSSKNLQSINTGNSLLNGLVFGGPFASNLRLMQQGNYWVYTA